MDQPKSDSQPQRMWPALINLINSNADYWRAQSQKANEPQSYDMGFWTMVAACGACGGVVVAIGAAFVFWLQLRAMSGQLAEMKKTRIEAGDAMRLDQRAWVGVKEIRLSKPLIVGQLVQIAVTLANTGKTPALDGILSEVRIGPSETDRSRDLVVKSTEYAVIAPNNTDSFLETTTYDDNSIKAIQGGSIRIFIRGRFEYKDIWGSIHATTFCAYYPTNGPAAAADYFFNCATGNSMD